MSINNDRCNNELCSDNYTYTSAKSRISFYKLKQAKVVPDELKF